MKGPGAGGNWGWRREKRAGKSKVTRMLGRETGANEGAEGDKVACKQGGGLGMVEGGEGARGAQGEVAGGAEGAPEVSKSCRRGGPAARRRDGRGAAVLGGSAVSRGEGGSGGG